jgi:hypothetical protein
MTGARVPIVLPSERRSVAPVPDRVLAGPDRARLRAGGRRMAGRSYLSPTSSSEFEAELSWTGTGRDGAGRILTDECRNRVLGHCLDGRPKYWHKPRRVVRPAPSQPATRPPCSVCSIGQDRGSGDASFGAARAAARRCKGGRYARRVASVTAHAPTGARRTARGCSPARLPASRRAVIVARPMRHPGEQLLAARAFLAFFDGHAIELFRAEEEEAFPVLTVGDAGPPTGHQGRDRRRVRDGTALPRRHDRDDVTDRVSDLRQRRGTGGRVDYRTRCD